MRYKRKIAAALVFVITMLASPFYGRALPGKIHQASKIHTITSGVTLEKITRFTDEGWLKINVLTTDLSNNNIKIDTLVSDASIRTLAATDVLADSVGAVAAINGSFFMWTDEKGKINPIGPMVSSGDLKTAYNDLNYEKDAFATLSIDNLNQVYTSYWKTEMELISHTTGESVPVVRYNRPYYGYSELLIVDRKFSSLSIGQTLYHNDILEVVVDNGEIVEMREGKSPAAIPENGYVVVTRAEGAQKIKSNFKTGDKVSFNISTSPRNWDQLKMSVTGGAILLQNGAIPDKFSHDIPGRHPRTAIGTSKGGKKLIMVTVDGRQQSSIGLTQLELAELLMELGVHNAVNLDGGGSTTMIARQPGTNDMDVINSPSDGIVRKIANAVGIISLAPPSALDGLIISTDDGKMFAGTTRKFTVKGYDRYFNPVAVDPETVKWNVSGIEGVFEGSSFIASTPGKGIITASVNGISGQFPVECLNKPSEMQVVPDKIRLPMGSSKELKVIGRDAKGYRAIIYPEDISWKVNGAMGMITDGIFTSTAMGSGFIEAGFKDIRAYSSVAVPQYKTKILDDFEKMNGIFKHYPESVKGSYEISSRHPFEGSTFSGKLHYNFLRDPDVTRAAYLEFADGGIDLEPNTVKLGLKVYNTLKTPAWLRARIIDTSGKVHNVDFTRSLDWHSKWKDFEVSVEGFVPAKITRIYIAQIHRVQDIGSIYFDNLTATTYGYVDEANIPSNTMPQDMHLESVDYDDSPESFRVAVFNQSSDCKNPLESIYSRLLAKRINKSVDAAATTGGKTAYIDSLITKPLLATTGGFKSIDVKNTRMIQLDSNDNSLRTAINGQWQWFINQLNSFPGKNILIFLDKAPGDFDDKAEGKLFKDILSGYANKNDKNVWVLISGSKNTAFMDEGVKYLTIGGLDVNGITPENPADFALVTIQGNKITYDVKPVVTHIK